MRREGHPPRFSQIYQSKEDAGAMVWKSIKRKEIEGGTDKGRFERSAQDA